MTCLKSAEPPDETPWVADAGSSEQRDDTNWSVRRVFEKELDRDEDLFVEGDPGDVVYVVQSGHIELTREGPEGPRILSRKGPGDLFGEMDVLLGAPRSARARAVGPARVLELDGATFESMCVDQPEIAIRVIQQLADRARVLERRLAALGGDDLLRPLVRVLLRRARRGDEGPATVANSLRELATDAGLTLLETHRALGHLVDRRVVKLVEDRLEVADFDALTAAVDAPEALAS